MATEAATCSHQDEARKGVSGTAHGVAAIRAIETKLDPNFRLFADPYAEALAGKVGKDFIDNNPNFQIDHPIIQRGAVRTKKIDDEILKAVNEEDFTQICVLGAGLDSRPWRLQISVDHPIHYFEVDFQEIFDFKLPTLASEGAITRFAYHNVVADLTAKIDTWPEVMLAAGYDPTVPTLWLLEGFINYLTREEAVALMNRLSNQLSAPGSRIVATSITSLTPRRPGALHQFFPDDALVFFGEHGWVGVQTEIDELAKSYGREILNQPYNAYFLVVAELMMK
jgi:methyltransferase (TIGR00027 family)